ncbi:MAG: S1 RNA-binding domain-containing protein, partial [Solirubrobacteraceae bacterium]
IQPGDPVRVKILEIDSERRRLSLSIKRVEGQVLPVRPIEPPAGEDQFDDVPELGLSEDVFAGSETEVPAEFADPEAMAEVAEPEATAEVGEPEASAETAEPEASAEPHASVETAEAVEDEPGGEAAGADSDATGA